MLDETANIAPIPDLAGLASTGAGQGIQLLTVFQDLAQISAVYGKWAQTILNNHRAKVFASGIADRDTLSYVSHIIGQGEFSQRSETTREQGPGPKPWDLPTDTSHHQMSCVRQSQVAH